MPNTACPRLLEKAKPLRWSQQQQNAAREKQAGSCWILAPCFPTRAGFCTNIPSKLMRKGRNKRKKKGGLNLLEAKEPGESSSKWQLTLCLPPVTRGRIQPCRSSPWQVLRGDPDSGAGFPLVPVHTAPPALGCCRRGYQAQCPNAGPFSYSGEFWEATAQEVHFWGLWNSVKVSAATGSLAWWSFFLIPLLLFWQEGSCALCTCSLRTFFFFFFYF